MKKELTLGDPVAFRGHKYEFVSEFIGMATIKSYNGDTKEVRTDKLTRLSS